MLHALLEALKFQHDTSSHHILPIIVILGHLYEWYTAVIGLQRPACRASGMLPQHPWLR